MYRHPNRFLQNFSSVLDSMFDLKEEPADPQLCLDLEPPRHTHKWYDDDGDRGIGLYCECGAFSEVTFGDDWEGKTNQEVFELLQRQRHYKI